MDVFMSVAEQIEEKNFAIIDNFLEGNLAAALLEESLRLYNEGEFIRAGIGKGLEKKRISEVRGDSIYWLDQPSSKLFENKVSIQIHGLMECLSEHFRQNLRRFEYHYALYPKGSFYDRHFDQFRSTSNRIFSFIIYLNKDWELPNGGQLRIYEGDQITDIEPIFNRLCCFRSDIVEHEVLLTQKQRISLTGWLRNDYLTANNIKVL